MLSSPSSRQVLRKGSISNDARNPASSVTVCPGRSTERRYGWPAAGEKDVGERGGDDDAKPGVGQRPRGVLSAGSAPEIPSGDEDARARLLGPIEFEGGVERAIGPKTPVEEQILAEARAFDPFQKLLGDDLVGIDIGPVEGGHDSGERHERFHQALADG